MTGVTLADWVCRYCGHTIHPKRGERAVGDITGRTIRYRHVICPREIRPEEATS